jgi:hypothetical protein
LPAAAREARPFIAEKSFVNDVAEIDGVAAAVVVEVVELAVDELVDELLELPHAASANTTAAAAPTGATRVLRKCIWSLSFCRRAEWACTRHPSRLIGDRRKLAPVP